MANNVIQLLTEPYAQQALRWPKSGRHILAQYDARSIMVYQAYSPQIGQYAARLGCFGPGFSLNRMSWIKPGFLWMMYRSGWGKKPLQETVLAIHIAREAFDRILSAAVHSSFVPDAYASQEQWRAAVQSSDVRLQWDPDHDPAGHRLERRAIQLGLRGDALADYAHKWIVGIEDISEFVHAQHELLLRNGPQALVTPIEHVYPVHDARTRARLGLDPYPDHIDGAGPTQ